MYASILGVDWTSDTLFILMRSPLFWWIIVFCLFFIIEKFDLGIHCFSWFKNLKKGQADCSNGTVSNSEEQVDGANGFHPISNSDLHDSRTTNSHVLQNGHVPVVLHNFVRHKLIPTFSSHSKEEDPHFSVLVLSNIPSEQKIKEVKFRQVTFNGMPLVDPQRLTYPHSYRYENYIVARPSESEHAEAMIVKELKSLVKAYGVKERCYLRTPVPKFGLLYSRTMPCTECIELVAKTLPSICSQKIVLVYSQESSEERDIVQENLRTLKNAGIMVAKIPE